MSNQILFSFNPTDTRMCQKQVQTLTLPFREEHDMATQVSNQYNE